MEVAKEEVAVEVALEVDGEESREVVEIGRVERMVEEVVGEETVGEVVEEIVEEEEEMVVVEEEGVAMTNLYNDVQT